MLNTNKRTQFQKISQTIKVISILIIFSNGMGAMAWSFLGFQESPHPHPDTFSLVYIMDYYQEACIFMVCIGTIYLLGAIFLEREKLWAKYLVIIISVVLIILIWALMFSFYTSFININSMKVFAIGALINAFIWSIPLVLLIRSLMNKVIQKK